LHAFWPPALIPQVQAAIETVAMCRRRSLAGVDAVQRRPPC